MKGDPVVLVAVLKDRRDRRLLLKERWYRIPAARSPRRPFDYIAFYQPESFGRDSKRIRFYARVLGCRVARRLELIPWEPSHPWAKDAYFRFRLGPVRVLPKPILNTAPRRVTFGFTTRERLLKSRELLRLYSVPHIEKILMNSLRRSGVEAEREHTVRCGKRRRFRLDFAVYRPNGRIAIECDGKDHAGRTQRLKDKVKDAYLGRNGWKVLRFSDREILRDAEGCARRVLEEIRRLARAGS